MKNVLNAIILVLLAMEEKIINVNHACQEDLFKRESDYSLAKKEHIKIPRVNLLKFLGEILVNSFLY